MFHPLVSFGCVSFCQGTINDVMNGSASIEQSFEENIRQSLDCMVGAVGMWHVP